MTPMTVREILETVRTIAVVGARDKHEKAGFYVGEYLVGAGYEVTPVSPRLAGTRLWGRSVVASLKDVDAPIDLVNIFRRGPDVPQHLDEILAMEPLPKVVWLQLGIRNDAVASALEARGVQVVQNRCTLADHRRLGL